ncbi:MAG: type II CAAX endopeptidase family protein [Planctomycetota bacterium]|nr:type II CAAX endopeptidase family protein [Planctomycetota bacterium]
MPPPAAPRLRFSLGVLLAAIPCLVIVSVLGLLGGSLLVTHSLPTSNEGSLELIGDLLAHPLGIAFLILPGQVTLIALAAFPAAFSPTAFRRRLGLVPWTVSTRSVLLLVAAAPAVQFLAVLPVQLLGLEADEQLEFIGRLISEPRGLSAVIMFSAVVFGAGFAEELLFRGYVQRRLLQRWSAPAAIAVPGVVFAAMHMSPVHALGVLPLGLWMGFLAWRTGSVVPAMLAHMTNNALGVVVALLTATPAEGASMDMAQNPSWYWIGVAVGAVCLVAGLRSLARETRERQP